MEITKGVECLLDGVEKVTVVKPLNRAKTMYCVEQGSSLLTVERERLTIIGEHAEEGKQVEVYENHHDLLKEALAGATGGMSHEDQEWED